MTKKENEKLIELANDICWIKKMLANHFRHHWMVTLALLGITGSAISALIILLLTH